MISAVEVAEAYHRRKAADEPMTAQMREIRDTVDGDIYLPLPELEREERPAVANLTATGLDQLSMRISSVLPDVQFFTSATSDAARKRTTNRRRVAVGWWEQNWMLGKLSRRARYLAGYGCSPVSIGPNNKMGMPWWRVRDPLSTFPAESLDFDDFTPSDVITASDRSFGWIKANFPEHARAVKKPDRDQYGQQALTNETPFTLLTYVDDTETVLVLLGKVEAGQEQTNGAALELMRVHHDLGITPMIYPGRITLSRRQGQFNQMVGMYQAQARMMALETIAVEKGIFTDQWLVARANETPRIIQTADGRRGRVGVVQGGDFKKLQDNPGYQTLPTIDRLERAQRLTGGVPSDFGGESQTNVRTGRRGETLLGAVIDFPIMEYQQIMARSMELELSVAIEVDKRFHNTAKSFHVGWKGAVGKAEYTPSELFRENDTFFKVSYAHAGADANALAIGGGQRVGMGTMSKRGFMDIDPMIDDPEREIDRVTAERLGEALLAGIENMTAQGQIPPSDVARIMRLVETDEMSLPEAVAKVQEEAQQRQAELAEEQSAEAQPGIAVPGAGAEQPTVPPSIQQTPDSMSNLAGMSTSLRRPAMTVGAERGEGLG